MKAAQALKIPFAYSEAGLLIEPSAAEEGGVFRCPGCKGEVRRRRSSRGRLHFYHRDPRDQRETCGETALHLAAKAILEKSDSLRLPELRLSVPSPTGGPVHVYPGGIFMIEKAELEVSLDNRERVVDAVLSGNASPSISPKVYIEICVTNPVIGERKSWFRKCNVPAVEISLCDLKNLDLNALRAALNHPANQRWIHHPNYRTVLAENREKLRLAEEDQRKTIAAHRAREEAKRRKKQEILERRQRLQARAYDEFRAKFLPNHEAAAREARWARQLRVVEDEQFPIALAIASTHPNSLQPQSRWIINQRSRANSPAVWLVPCLRELAVSAPYSVADPLTVCDLARHAEINDSDAFHLLSKEICVDEITSQLIARGRKIAKEAGERERRERQAHEERVSIFHSQASKVADVLNDQNRKRERELEKQGRPVQEFERWIACPTCLEKKSFRWRRGNSMPQTIECNCTNPIEIPLSLEN